MNIRSRVAKNSGYLIAEISVRHMKARIRERRTKAGLEYSVTFVRYPAAGKKRGYDERDLAVLAALIPLTEQRILDARQIWEMSTHGVVC